MLECGTPLCIRYFLKSFYADQTRAIDSFADSKLSRKYQDGSFKLFQKQSFFGVLRFKTRCLFKKMIVFSKNERSLKKLNEKRSFSETINPTYIVRKRTFY